MKKLICLLVALLMLSLCLASCGNTVSHPEIKEGEFNVSVTYEQDGELKTLELVYICEYGGVKRSIEGARYRAWNGRFDGYGVGEVIPLFDTEDGGAVALCFLIYPEFFMGEPDYALDFYPQVLANYIYYEDGDEMIEDNQELIAENYGVRIVGCEYDTPIENKFGE